MRSHFPGVVPRRSQMASVRLGWLVPEKILTRRMMREGGSNLIDRELVVVNPRQIEETEMSKVSSGIALKRRK